MDYSAALSSSMNGFEAFFRRLDDAVNALERIAAALEALVKR